MFEVNYGNKLKLLKCKEIYSSIEDYIKNTFFYKEDSIEKFYSVDFETTISRRFNIFDIRAKIKTINKENGVFFEYELRFAIYTQKDFDIDNINKYDIYFDKQDCEIYICFKEKSLGKQIIDNI